MAQSKGKNMTLYFNSREKDNLTLKEAMEAEIEILQEILSEGVVHVLFKKLDGSFREIKGTTCKAIIGDYDETKLPKTFTPEDEKYVRFYDVEENGWRTFYKENVVDYWT